MESKKEVSNATRVDQATVLVEDMSDDIVGILFGKGLGHTVSRKTDFRDYTGNIYYELQTIYFMNQLGLIPFICFLCLNIYFTLKYIKYRKYIILYIAYVIYAVTNPYILNTNQVVVIITLVSLANSLKRKTYKEKNRRSIGFVQS